MGGLPYEDTDDHNTVTVLQGNEHVALDFTSEVVDYVTITGRHCYTCTLCVHVHVHCTRVIEYVDAE